jgi:thiamine pyrophosphokinase
MLTSGPLLQMEEFFVNGDKMMLALIFANGELCLESDNLLAQEADLILAADGGSRHCQELELLPDILIGDLDSTPSSLVNDWREQGVTILDHPVRKNQTDLELALLEAQDRGADQILVYGAVGGRWDMTFANLMLLAHPELQAEVSLICGREIIQILHPGETLKLHGQAGDIVSIIPLTPGASTITTENLEYPLRSESLEFGSSRGISNQLAANKASIHLEQGLISVIHTRS